MNDSIQPSRSFSIITFNIWDIPFWFSKNREERIARIGPYIKQYNPDIMCLQESFDVWHRDQIYEALGKDGYSIIEGYKRTRYILGFVRRFDLTGGLVIFSKFPIRKTVFEPFSLWKEMNFWERRGRKGFLDTLIETPFGMVRIINTHLHDGTLALHRFIRARQITQLTRAIKNHDSEESIPLIIAGDLNEDDIFDKEAPHPLRVLNIRDSATNNEPTLRVDNPYANRGYNRANVSHRFDYVLVRDIDSLRLNVSEYRVLPQPDPPLSDHNPVLVRFLLQ
ncbi:MAG: endonuclease/exonuclease/phosphatase family protein [Parcubacteria group bacterium]|nr:endonuclease/exonuclease/phosphatase family protein [Parcubacteria group bacterium]